MNLIVTRGGMEMCGLLRPIDNHIASDWLEHVDQWFDDVMIFP
jgi:hypothetical protein